MSEKDYKVIRISEEGYELLKKARKLLMEKGTNTLPPELRNIIDVNSKNPVDLGSMVMLSMEAILHLIRGKEQ